MDRDPPHQLHLKPNRTATRRHASYNPQSTDRTINITLS